MSITPSPNTVGTGRRLEFLRAEDDYGTRFCGLPFAIAAPGGLDDRIERTEGAEGYGEVHDHTGLDQLRRNQPTGQPVAQPLANGFQFLATMLRTQTR